MARGTYVFPPDESMRLITDIFSYCAHSYTMEYNFNKRISHKRNSCTFQSHIHSYGALNYVDAAIQTGLDIDEFAPRLSFFFNCHNDFRRNCEI